MSKDAGAVPFPSLPAGRVKYDLMRTISPFVAKARTAYHCSICGLKSSWCLTTFASHTELRPPQHSHLPRVWELSPGAASLATCSSLLSVALIDTMTKWTPGRTGFGLQLTVYHWGKPSQELKQRPRRNCFLMHCELTFSSPNYASPGPPAQEQHYPQCTGSSYINN